MEARDCIIASSDALADLVLAYERERGGGLSLQTARLRKQMVDAAHGAKAVNDSARALFAAVTPIKSDLSWTPFGVLPHAARGPVPANDLSSHGDNIA